MIRRLSAIGHRRMGSTQASIPLPPELAVIYDADRLILQHSRTGRVVSMYVQVDLEDYDASTPHEGHE